MLWNNLNIKFTELQNVYENHEAILINLGIAHRYAHFESLNYTKFITTNMI